MISRDLKPAQFLQRSPFTIWEGKELQDPEGPCDSTLLVALRLRPRILDVTFLPGSDHLPSVDLYERQLAFQGDVLATKPILDTSFLRDVHRLRSAETVLCEVIPLLSQGLVSSRSRVPA